MVEPSDMNRPKHPIDWESGDSGAITATSSNSATKPDGILPPLLVTQTSERYHRVFENHPYSLAG